MAGVVHAANTMLRIAIAEITIDNLLNIRVSPPMKKVNIGPVFWVFLGQLTMPLFVEHHLLAFQDCLNK